MKQKISGNLIRTCIIRFNASIIAYCSHILNLTAIQNSICLNSGVFLIITNFVLICSFQMTLKIFH